MASAIDAALEPRVRVGLELSAEGAQRLHDMLTGLAADLHRHAGIEGSWPALVALAALEEAADGGESAGGGESARPDG